MQSLTKPLVRPAKVRTVDMGAWLPLNGLFLGYRFACCLRLSMPPVMVIILLLGLKSWITPTAYFADGLTCHKDFFSDPMEDYPAACFLVIDVHDALGDEPAQYYFD